VGRHKRRTPRAFTTARAPRPLPDVVDGVEVRRIQPFQAVKRYRCPGCNQEIPPGIGHVVAVPQFDPAQRRHWHTPCWAARDRRR
jgi:hypothetical protein